jgi:hypothetical protein
MNTKVYALAAHDQSGVSLYSKMFIISLILALVFAFLPLANVLAAPASVTETDDLPREWKNKLDNLRAYSLFYTQVRLYPADFEDPDDLARAHFLLEKYGIALKQANTLVVTHPGFDSNGKVTNEKLAVDSVNDLAETLRIMRGIWHKMDDEDIKFHRLR